MKRINWLLLIAAGALASVPLLYANSRNREFVGTDNHAARLVSELRPEYKPWFSPIFTPPSAEIERLLFGIQAALGAAVLTYCIAHSRASRSHRHDHATHD